MNRTLRIARFARVASRSRRVLSSTVDDVGFTQTKRFFSQHEMLPDDVLLHTSLADPDDAETDAEVRATVRALCSKYPGSYWRDLEDRSEYPTQFVEDLGKAGILGLLIPEEYGGSQAKFSTACAVLEEIHRSGCNGGAAHAQMYMMESLLQFGTDEQKSDLLPKIASGEIRFQSFGVSEPNNGTDTLGLETTATLKDDVYVVQGQKMWTSRAEHSDYMLLLARTKPEKSAKSLTCFLVDMKEALKKKQLTIKKIDAMINHSTCQLFFDDLEIPTQNVVGKEGEGFKVILSAMNAERVLIASECIGDAKFFLDKSVDYAKNRKVFGRPIGQNQGVSFPLAQCYADTLAASLVVKAACAKLENNLDAGKEANLAKHLASEASFKAGDVAMQTHGGFSFAREYDVERKWRETRLYRIAPVSTNLILSFVAEKVLGLPRSY